MELHKSFICSFIFFFRVLLDFDQTEVYGFLINDWMLFIFIWNGTSLRYRASFKNIVEGFHISKLKSGITKKLCTFFFFLSCTPQSQKKIMIITKDSNWKMQELQKDLYKLKRVTGEKKKNLRAVCDQCECMSESKSTFGKICWWRRQLLIGELSI